MRKKGKLDVRSFKSQLITIGNTRTYLLDATKRDLLHTYFTVTPGCTITDAGHCYVVRDVWYYRRPKYVFLTGKLCFAPSLRRRLFFCLPRFTHTFDVYVKL